MMKELKIGTTAAALLIGFEAQAASVYVRDIKVEGLERVEPETVISYVDVKKMHWLATVNWMPLSNSCIRPGYLTMFP